jgi:hypothetical protein
MGIQSGTDIRRLPLPLREGVRGRGRAGHLFYRHYDPLEVAEYVEVGETEDPKTVSFHPFVAD